MTNNLRNPEFAKYPTNEMVEKSNIIRDQVLQETKRLLNIRDKTKSYLESDNEIFIPFIDTYVIGCLIHRFESIYRELGRYILEIIYEYEDKNVVNVNKESIY